jgi:hypothetical protein
VRPEHLWSCASVDKHEVYFAHHRAGIELQRTVYTNLVAADLAKARRPGHVLADCAPEKMRQAR